MKKVLAIEALSYRAVGHRQDNGNTNGPYFTSVVAAMTMWVGGQEQGRGGAPLHDDRYPDRSLLDSL